MEQVQMVKEVLGNTIAQLLQVLGQNKGYDLQQTLCALQHLPTLVQKAACPREMHPLPPATGHQVEARVEDIAAQGERRLPPRFPVNPPRREVGNSLRNQPQQQQQLSLRRILRMRAYRRLGRLRISSLLQVNRAMKMSRWPPAEKIKRLKRTRP